MSIFPPNSPKKTYTEMRHNITREDEFRWLRDENWKDVLTNPKRLQKDIRAYLESENRYVAYILQENHSLQEALILEMRNRIKEHDILPAIPRKEWAWFEQFLSDKEYPQICRSQRNGDNSHVVLDINIEAQYEIYFKLKDTRPNPEQTMLAWSADKTGGENFTIHIRNIDSGKDEKDTLTHSSGDMAWSSCSQYIFYVARDTHHRPNRVMCHKRSTSQKEDILIYEESDSGFFVNLESSCSGEIIFINIHNHETSEIRMIQTHKPLSVPILITRRIQGLEYRATHDIQRNRLILLTNYNQAIDFQIMYVSLHQDTLTPAHWQNFLPYQQGTLILDVIPYKDHIAWLSREKALPQINIMSLMDKKITQIQFNEEIYALAFDVNAEYDTDICRFSYSSMTTPKQIFDYDMTHHTRKIIYEQSIPSGHNASDYITKRLWAEARDGQMIPLSLLHHKDTALDCSAPVLLYGYGAYGVTIPSYFSPHRLSLVDRGFIYVIAHIRGGKEMGYHWYKQGRGKDKKNTFFDFIDVTKMLIKEKITRKGNVTIHGGSAGGLLIGASLNLAPDLFCGAVAEVPFVDILNTMLDDTLPLTPPEWPEWGNPITCKEDYEIIADYAPYENISPMDYPHILATSGLTDPRVTYWEATKWIARLRDRRTDNRLTLLHTNMHAGHGGKAGRFHQLREYALIYSFILAIHRKTPNEHI